jgi:hypothetical protein
VLVLRGHVSVYMSETFVRCRAVLARKNTEKKRTRLIRKEKLFVL